MLIDWFTVGAQIVNFVVLMWLLQRFLYGPITAALDAREQRIAAELADATAARTEARKERENLVSRNAELEQRRAALLDQAAREAETEGRRLLDRAREAADELSARRHEQLKSDAQNLVETIGAHARQEVFAIARKALADLAATDLDERLVEMFLRRLRELPGPAKTALAETLATRSEPALIRSAFELPAAQRASILNALKETLAVDVDARFEVAPDLVSGIELTADGQRLGWSIADYVASLEAGVGVVVAAQLKSRAADASAPERSFALAER